MNNKRIFSPGLYLEGIRKIKVPAVLFTVILFLEAILIPIGKVITTEVREDNIGIASGFNVQPMLILSFLVITPILTWSMFSFLNRRNSSDFFHSIPHTRLCIYISFLLAAITWIAIIVFATSAVSIVTHLILGKYYTLLTGAFISYALGCFAASLLVSSAIIIAMTLTGTVFNNIIVTLLILFLPRYLIFIVTNAVYTRVPIIPEGYLIPILGDNLNIVSGLFSNFFMSTLFYGNSDTSLTLLASQIYTAVLAVIYFAIGAVLFKIRKSESAERPAPNKMLQTVFRVSLTMVICSLICFIIFTSREPTDIWFITAVLIIAALVMYSAYEIVTTKKLSSLLHSLPGLGVVAALSVALYGIMYGIYTVELNFTPPEDKISSISVIESINEHYLTVSDYAGLLRSEIKITDSEIIGELAETLEAESEKVKAENANNQWTKSYSYYEQKYIFKIEGKNFCKYRALPCKNKTYAKIKRLMENEPGEVKRWTELPEAVKGTLSTNTDMSENDLNKLFSKMKMEIKEIDLDKWRNWLTNNKDVETFSSIHYTTIINGKNYNMSIPFSPEILPETSDVYLKIIYENSKNDIDKIKSILTSESNKAISLNADLHVSDASTGKFQQYILMEDYSSSMTVRNILAESIVEEAAVSGKDYIHLSVYDSSISDTFLECTVKINPDIKDELMKYFTYEEIYYYD